MVELGGNDLLRGQPVAVTRAKLSEIVAAGKRAGAAVVLVGISAPGSVGAEHKAAFDALYPAVAREHDITLLPGFLDPLMGRPTCSSPTDCTPPPKDRSSCIHSGTGASQRGARVGHGRKTHRHTHSHRVDRVRTGAR